MSAPEPTISSWSMTHSTNYQKLANQALLTNIRARVKTTFIQLPDHILIYTSLFHQEKYVLSSKGFDLHFLCAFIFVLAPKVVWSTRCFELCTIARPLFEYHNNLLHFGSWPLRYFYKVLFFFTFYKCNSGIH